MWCDDCKHIVARAKGDGSETGHRNNRCAGVNMWELPPAVASPSISEAADTVEELAEAGDRELNAWLMRHAGTTELSAEDLRMFRQQLDATRKIIN